MSVEAIVVRDIAVVLLWRVCCAVLCSKLARPKQQASTLLGCAAVSWIIFSTASFCVCLHLRGAHPFECRSYCGQRHCCCFAVAGVLCCCFLQVCKASTLLCCLVMSIIMSGKTNCFHIASFPGGMDAGLNCVIENIDFQSMYKKGETRNTETNRLLAKFLEKLD